VVVSALPVAVATAGACCDGPAVALSRGVDGGGGGTLVCCERSGTRRLVLWSNRYACLVGGRLIVESLYGPLCPRLIRERRQWHGREIVKTGLRYHVRAPLGLKHLIG
jgi:hypothetical protein